jgi:hypothetical protein
MRASSPAERHQCDRMATAAAIAPYTTLRSFVFIGAVGNCRALG